MFEEYLRNAHEFFLKAEQLKNEQHKKQYYRVSIFCSISAVESFIYYVGKTLSGDGPLSDYEIAFLLDKKMELKRGRFEVTDKLELHRLEDKLKFLIAKFIASFSFCNNSSWSNFLEIKKLRNMITHPKNEDDEITISCYRRVIKKGLSAQIDIINSLCINVFDKPLRKKIADLKL